MEKRVDFLVIGGGILGISIGRELLLRFPNSRILVAEKESDVAAHASGRNSGVLHAGFYYSPDSLKARFCLEGNQVLRHLITKHNLPLNPCGKVVVAKDVDDLSRLDDLLERGLANGVELFKYPEEELNKYEPLAKTYRQFLWSPNTAVSDPILVTKLLRDLFISEGGEVKYNAEINIEDEENIFICDIRIQPKHIINASGANAIHIAHKVNAGKKYSQLPVLGKYKITSSSNIPLRTLVYPVPNPKNPFLGVHFTLTVDGDVKIGPTAIPVLGREQYKVKDFPDNLDYSSTVKSLTSLFHGSASGLLNLAVTELPKISTKKLVRDGQNLVPTISPLVKWENKRPGIRAQLVNLEKQGFEMDFVIEKNGIFTHVLNAVSPGWTSAIPFAKFIVDNFES